MYTLATTDNEFVINELVKLLMLWTTGRWLLTLMGLITQHAFYIIVRGESSVYLVKTEVVSFIIIVKWYRIISLVINTIYIFTPRFWWLHYFKSGYFRF